MFLSPRSKKQFPCNHIWREAVCERQAVMWNKCRTQGLYKKSGVLTPYPCKPEQMVCGVSALGGHGPSLGGVGRSAHQMTSYPSIDFFFYSWFFGLAYSGELDHGQGTRACICSAQADGGRIWGRTSTEIKIPQWPEVICWAELMYSVGTVKAEFWTLPAYRLLPCWPCLAL